MTRHTASKRLFEAFHDDDVSYCHWKSNEHLRGEVNEVRRKAEAVESLEFESETVTIDANRPLEDVLLDVRREVWKRI